MSVFVSDFKATGGGWTVTHDDAVGGAHSGTIQPGEAQYVAYVALAGANGRFLAVTCPVCGATTSHPVAGGAQPREVQELFVRTLLRAGQACPCGNLPAGRPLALVLGHLKSHADQQDFSGRWAVSTGNYVP